MYTGSPAASNTVSLPTPYWMVSGDLGTESEEGGVWGEGEEAQKG